MVDPSAWSGWGEGDVGYVDWWEWCRQAHITTCRTRRTKEGSKVSGGKGRGVRVSGKVRKVGRDGEGPANIGRQLKKS